VGGEKQGKIRGGRIVDGKRKRPIGYAGSAEKLVREQKASRESKAEGILASRRREMRGRGRLYRTLKKRG